MPRHARKRSPRTRRFLTGGAISVGTLVMACTAATGSAQAATATAPTYTVKAGDHLASIARALKVPGGWPAIASANHLGSPYSILPGQVLTLPAGSAAPAKAATTKAAPASTSSATGKTYANNLDGWIKQALAVMAQNHIPGTYNGIYRNIMRESSGNPNAINNWDSNAAKGTPSKGLLQVIQPTFDAYHVPGTSTNIYDPVANITAACNYAYHRYGSIDNVFSAY